MTSVTLTRPAPTGQHRAAPPAPDAPSNQDAQTRRGVTWSVAGEQVVLRDGTVALVRELTTDDREALVAFHATVSDDSIYKRYFTLKRHLTERDLTMLTAVDGTHRVAFVVEVAGAIVAVGRYMSPLRRDGSAELAFLVADAWHGKGLCPLLLDRLIVRAQHSGIAVFTAEVLSTNTPMMRVLERSGLPMTRSFQSGTVCLTMPLTSALPAAA